MKKFLISEGAIKKSAFLLFFLLGVLVYMTKFSTMNSDHLNMKREKYAGLLKVKSTNPKSIISEKREILSLSLEEVFSENTSAPNSRVLPNKDKILIQDWNGKKNHIFIYSIKENKRSLLVKTKERFLISSVSSDGKYALFLKDENGNEMYQIFLLNLKTKEFKALTKNPKAYFSVPEWSPQGDKIALISNQDSPKHPQLYTLSLKDQSLTRITFDEVSKRSPVWVSENKIALSATNDFSKGNLRIYSLKEKSYKSYNFLAYPGRLSKNKKYLPLTKMPEERGFSEVGFLNMETDKVQWIHQNRECFSPRFSKNGSKIAFLCFSHGNRDIVIADINEGKASKVFQTVTLNGWIYGLVFLDNEKILYTRTSTTLPYSLEIVDLKDKSIKNILKKNSLEKYLVEPKVVFYKTFDDLKIPGLLYMPPNLKRDGSNSAIVFIHGGPSGASLNLYSSHFSFLINRGYIILAPNIRGSSFYGKEYEDLNNMDWGGGDLEDLKYGVKFLLETGYVDSKKVIAYGTSYGGYMTLMALTKQPNVWAAGIDVIGFSNLETFFGTTKKEFKDYLEREMGDQSHIELWKERSPIYFVDKIQAPLLIIQGAKDPRAPLSEATSIYNQLIKSGKKTKLVIYEDEGHGIKKRKNFLDCSQKILDFLKTSKLSISEGWK